MSVPRKNCANQSYILESYAMNPSRNASPDRDEELEALVCDCLDLLLPILPSGQKDVVYAIDVEVSTLLAIGRQGVKEQLNMMQNICPKHGLADCDCDQAAHPET